MSLRFQKRKKIAPGASVNLSKSSASIGIGIRGARLSLGRRGMRGSVGIPASGISLTSLGIGRMGGLGAIVAVFVLLIVAILRITVAIFQIGWIMFKVMLQISMWGVKGIARMLSMVFEFLQNRNRVATRSKVRRSAQRMKK